jgi:iron complex outermembrane recepter protein
MYRLIISFTLIIFMLLPGLAAPADQPAPTGKEEDKQSQLDEIIVTAPPMTKPLETQFDPKAAQQPLPAQDGAAFLKNVPGMSVIRKGGTDGDVVFRGMAGSRLGILLDGQTILGGCGNRMDPPTAYIYPETYDRVTIIKGPQSVIYGPSSPAGLVLFERENKPFDKPGVRLFSSVLGGSFGRHDEVLDVTAGIHLFYVRGFGSYSHSDNYEDGDGRKVHSKYSRWNTGGAVGWTPNKDTKLEFSTAFSDGEAAYGDRAMDGVRFDRRNYGLKFERKNIAPWFNKIEAQIYYNYIDHVMDNYSLRDFVPTMKMPFRAVSNPDRETAGGRLAFTVRPFNVTKVIFGMDAQMNKHSIRSTMNESLSPYESMSRTEDANFMQTGVFAEGTQYLGDKDRIIAGIRGDWWNAQDKRQVLKLNLMTSVVNPTANAERNETLTSGFIRYEHDFSSLGATVYAGLGHSERFPDYWELVAAGKEGPTASDLSAFFTTKPEKNNQLDVGVTWKMGPLQAFVAGFVNKIDDFILIQSNVQRVAPVRTVSIVRNIDVTTLGGEAGVRYKFLKYIRADASIAYVYGQNDTENRPLAQIPPLEGKIGLGWEDKTWSVGTLLRLVAPQHRYAVNEGNIVGQDISETPGFVVFSINGAWTPIKGLRIAAGIDNLFNATYAEHISRSGAMVPGYEQTLRVNEPGRMFWVKGSYKF